MKGALDEAVSREALQWSIQRGSRSGRVAYQFARDWAGRGEQEILVCRPLRAWQTFTSLATCNDLDDKSKDVHFARHVYATIRAMTYDEFRRQLGKAGLTVKGFADLIKQSPNSITNHAKHGEVPPHLAIIAALMGDMAESGMDYRATLNRIQFDANRPRGGATKGRFGGSKRIDLQLPQNS